MDTNLPGAGHPSVDRQTLPDQAPVAPQVPPGQPPAGQRPTRSLVRLVLLLLINVLIVFGVVLLVRLCMAFFQPLATSSLFKPLAELTTPLILPTGVASIRTPFKGFFEVNTAITILAILAVEYLLNVVRQNS